MYHQRRKRNSGVFPCFAPCVSVPKKHISQRGIGLPSRDRLDACPFNHRSPVVRVLNQRSAWERRCTFGVILCVLRPADELLIPAVSPSIVRSGIHTVPVLPQ